MGFVWNQSELAAELAGIGGETSGRGWRGFCYCRQLHLCVCGVVCVSVIVAKIQVCVCMCVCACVFKITCSAERPN